MLSKKTIIIVFTIYILQMSAFAQKPSFMNIKILTTTDVHGAIYPYDFINDREVDFSLAQVHTYVNQQRKDTFQEVVLLDNGDILQGQPNVYYSNFEDVKNEHICSRVMNYMKYDAATIGNHDIEAGHPVYDKLIKEFRFPWLAANAINTATGKPYFKPYHIIGRNGVKIAVIGLITPAIPTWLPPKIWEGMEFEDMIESARKWVKQVKISENPDLIIGLFHAGIDFTYNNQNEHTYKNENATVLIAQKVPGFDVVFCGHDHRPFNQKVVNTDGDSVLILNARNYASHIAEASITLEMNKKTGNYKKTVSGDLIETKRFQPDTVFLGRFNKEYREVKEFVSKPIGAIEKTINSKESFVGCSEFVELIQQVMLDVTKADIAFAEPLAFNASIKEGKIYVRDLFNLYKYENLLYTMNLSGLEIKNYLEFSYAGWLNQMKNADDHVLLFKPMEEGEKPQLTGAFYNFSSAKGIIYTVNVQKPAGDRVTIKCLENGKPFALDQIYKVAVNSYRGNGGGGHLTDGAKINKDLLSRRIVASSQQDLRYYIMKWIESKHFISPVNSHNWKIVPEEWVKTAKEKDLKLLFPY